MRVMTLSAVLSLGLLAGCAGPGRVQETAAFVPRRDLTLTTADAPSVNVASKVELGAAAPHEARRASRARPATVVRPSPRAPVVAPLVVDPAPSPSPVAAAPTAPASEAVSADRSGRELAPGATVMVLPASTGGASSGETNAGWSEGIQSRHHGGVMIGGGHGGGRCGGGREGGGGGPVSILR